MDALAHLAAVLELPLDRRSLRMLWHDGPVYEEDELLVAAVRFGFTVTPLECGFDELADIELPCLLPLHEDDANHYAVGLRATAGEIEVLDRYGQRRIFARDSFCVLWQGTVIDIHPDPATMPQVLAEVRKLHRPGPRVALAGVALATLSGVVALQGTGMRQLLLLAAGAAATFATAATFYSDRCPGCSRSAGLVAGLPLAPMGLVFYALLAVSLFLGLPTSWPGGAFWVAAGGHAYLLGLLFQARVRCLLCLATAASCGLGLAGSWPSSGGWGPAALAACGGVGMLSLAMAARWRWNARVRRDTRRVVEDLVEEAHRRAEEPPRLVVYKRLGCRPCALASAIGLPVLQETWGESLQIEQRQVGDLALPTPFFFAAGLRNAAMSGLPFAGQELDHARLDELVRVATTPGPAQEGAQVVWLGVSSDSVL